MTERREPRGDEVMWPLPADEERTLDLDRTGITPAEQDRQLIIAQEVFAGRLVPTDEAAMERAIMAVNRAHESKIDATWRDLLKVAFRAAGDIE